MKIISNCPLCEEHSLHVIGEGGVQTQQCINCGYVTAEKLKLWFHLHTEKDLEDHYLKLQW